MIRYIRAGFLVAAVFFVTDTASAASLYIDPPFSQLNRGDTVSLAVRLDVDEAVNECVNAVDAVIHYSDNVLPIDISIGESIFNVWVETPTIDTTNKTITFAGGIPNGYCGRVAGDPRLTNVLTEIVFQSPGFTIGGSSNPEAQISFDEVTTAYLNDGRGTKAPLTTYPASITLHDRPGSNLSNPWQSEVEADRTPPEEFSITLEKGDGEYSNRYYIVFQTTDKQTGVDHYEVMEEPLTQFGSFQWGRADAPWVRVPHPPVYVLDDQSLNSIIRVKAIDKAGNEYVATLVPDESVRTLSGSQVMLIVLGLALLLLLVILVVIVRLVLRRRAKRVGQTAAAGVSVPETNADLDNE